ncbi:hypothetical protein BDN72DRAFT_846700 [Pluteus cervinus]|uniref:Uncharacterized protein n=1 Tax=Pluteus cervinus TaxID=181527 RepID=A0ACD3AEH4_9AGAR|nr:hypothetical protein BDN72DRAFT_846700 [Pluteus cervinus]
MSGQIPSGSPSFELPDLPSEVWLKVLREATWLPDVHFHESQPLGYIDQFDSIESLIKKQRVNLRSTASIIRVCARWKTWATPFLYESILIDKECPLISLKKTLSDSVAEAKNSPGRSPLGRLTTRLDLAVPGETVLGSELSDEWTLITSIISFLPSLQIVAISDDQGHSVIPQKALLMLLARSGKSLRVFTQGPGIFIRQDTLTGLLLHATQLKVLKLGHCVKIPLWLVDDIDLPNLVELDCPHEGITSRAFRLPPDSLRSLVIEDLYSATFMQNHCSSLTRLCLSYQAVRNDSFTIVVRSFAELCPNLRWLHLRFSDLFQYPSDFYIQKSVTLLEISTESNQATPQIYSDFITRIVQTKADGLKILRFPNPQNIKSMQKNCAKLLRGLLYHFDAKGIRVEDAEERLVKP